MVFPGKGDGVHGQTAGPNGGHAPQAAGKDDTLHGSEVQLLDSEVSSDGNAVGAHNGFPVQANGSNFDSGPAQKVQGSHSFGFFKTRSKKHIIHTQSSKHAATWR